MYLGNTTIAGTLSQQGATPAASVATTGGATTLTAAQYGAGTIIATGALTSPATFIVPNSGAWRVANRATGNFPLVVATAAGTGIAVPQGGSLSLIADGTNVVPAGGANPLAFQPLGALNAGGAIPFLNGRCLNQGDSGGFDVGGTSQVKFIPTVNSFGISVLFQNYLMAQEYETDNTNPITISAAFTDGTTLWPLAFAGQPSVTLAPRGSLRADLLAVTALAGTAYWVRAYVQLALPPINVVAAGSGSGGTLAAATYYYKITTVCGAQGESGGSSEVSYVATGSTSSVALTWNADTRTATPTGFNVYRGTATGAETFLCAVGLPAINAAGKYAWTDTGAIAVGATCVFNASIAADLLTINTIASGFFKVGDVITGAGVTAGTAITAYGHTGGYTGGGSWGYYTVSPSQTVASVNMTAAHTVPASQIMPVGPSTSGAPEGCNYPNYGSSVNNGTNQVADTASWASAAYAVVFGPTEVAGVPVAPPGKPLVVGIIGDSIEAGQNSGGPGGSSLDFGPAAQALIALNIPYRNMTRSGEALQFQATPDRFRSRGQLLPGCTHVIIESGTNDIWLYGRTQAQMETDLMTLATEAAAQGAKVLVTTITPRVTTTDSGVTVTNQTQNGTNEPIRQAENNWRRAGCPISPTTLAPVAIGTGGAILMGQSGHPIVGIVDYCAHVEVNASNALTVNGGYWGVSPIGATPPGTAVSIDGTHPTNPTGQALMKAAITAGMFK